MCSPSSHRGPGALTKDGLLMGAAYLPACLSAWFCVLVCLYVCLSARPSVCVPMCGGQAVASVGVRTLICPMENGHDRHSSDVSLRGKQHDTPHTPSSSASCRLHGWEADAHLPCAWLW